MPLSPFSISNSIRACLLAVSFIFFIGSSSHAAVLDDEGEEEPVGITADSLTFDPDTNLYIAEGNVEITQGRRSLSADKATMNKDTRDAVAEGSVILMEDGDILSAESIRMNLRSSTGTIKNGKIFIKKGNFHIKGDEIEKRGEKEYRIINGVFTACDSESPPWSFTATTADVTIDEYLTSWNSVFWAKNVPAFYTPYLVLPVKRERQSGFLIPRIGYSDRDGFEIGNDFFWAISRNTDATISLDYYSSSGVKEGLEYRYIMSKTAKGTFNGTVMEEFGKEELRWTLKQEHEQYFTTDFYNKTSLKYVSDDTYYSNYGETVEERSQDSLESYVSFTRNWKKFSLVTQFTYYKNLSGEQDTTLQKLPEMKLTGHKQQISDTPFYFSLSSSATEFYREEGESGERVDIYPRISMSLAPGGYFTFVPELGLRETAYRINERDHEYNREMYDLKGTLSTDFIRIYPLTGEKLRKVRHTIGPEFVYEYIPHVDQDDLPYFDSNDGIDKKNLFTYSLISRITGKIHTTDEDYSVKEMVYLKISQGYDINEAQRSLSTEEDDERRPFTDVTAELRIIPNDYISLTADSAFDTYDEHLSSMNVSFAATTTRHDSFSIDYRFTRDSNEYIQGKFTLKAAEYLDLSFDGKYSFYDGHYLENIYAAEYRHQCWSVNLSYTESPEEKKYYVVLNFLGMGTVGRFRGSTQY